jgi:hypothetical protein
VHGEWDDAPRASGISQLLGSGQLSEAGHHESGRISGDPFVRPAATVGEFAASVRDVVKRHRQPGSGRVDPCGKRRERFAGSLGAWPEQPVRKGNVHDVVAMGDQCRVGLALAMQVVAACVRHIDGVPHDTVLLRPDHEMKDAGHAVSSR